MLGVDDTAHELVAGSGGERGIDRRRGLLAATLLVLLLLVVVWWYLNRTAIVPDVVGLSRDRAKATIVKAGFVVGDVTTVTATPQEAGTVVDQDPFGGVRKLLGSGVDIQVGAVPGAEADSSSDGVRTLADEDIPWGRGSSGGPRGTAWAPRTASPGPRVPQVFGMTLEEARSLLSAAGYALGSASYGPSTTDVAAGLIYHQEPAPESYEPLGTSVDVWVSVGPPGGYPYPAPPKP